MKLLALDTSSEGCSAALLVDGEISERFELAPRGHTRLLMPMVRELLAEKKLPPADLGALAFACGPGSFTGVRIATGVVQGLAWGLDIPVVPVSSLEAVALGAIERMDARDETGIAVAFDARMGEVYWGCFASRAGLPVALAAEQVCPPEAVTLPAGPESWCGAGQGWHYRSDMPADVSKRVVTIDDTLVLRAAWVARLAAIAYEQGKTVVAEQAQPVYIRDEVTWKKLPGR
ncbi:tRNA (adenosine(37)-N6)-threonylcarbamoyltransferase complex dimerization subunit type 1 TsaB [Marinobacter sp. F3R08]|uniref:tRNA (adenosine(37)-N6)-threonylcarbamoyltransferase complex dimerization subunit type 1 TsaB n=1 Tax=Marinobacter sp. F3R08 TaxID=2841559 RepID=UPI001C09A22E|nr:tRNA (adenosine(37)-N6)-threonylcarbamoyltransferase complex dimerization subunit type 1 TsaB [Marinobacter sp. F3R08]MBU2954151.1 tRNA (adenosine(37)-N6)-threonylcarbamoyltransferase complex dimerization subunit type 1 TsaB [Marinobacter sp. F3R08]